VKKSYWARKLIAEFPSKTWKMSGLSYTSRKIEACTGSVQKRQGSGTKRTMGIRENHSRSWFSANKVRCKPISVWNRSRNRL